MQGSTENIRPAELSRSETRVPVIAFAELRQMAEAVSKSGLFACRSPDAALTLLLLAQAEGIHPIQAMRQFHIIENKPSLRADAMQAKYQAAGGRMKWITRTDAVVSAEFWHPSVHPDRVTVTWDDERVNIAGLNRGNHQKYPLQMKAARVISEGVRAVLPEIVVGLYTPEEMQDLDRSSPPERSVRPQKNVNFKVTDTPPNQQAEAASDGSDESFFAEWDIAVESRGATNARGRAFLTAMLKKNEIDLAGADVDWRRDRIDRLRRGDFDKALMPESESPSPASSPPAQQSDPGGETKSGDVIGDVGEPTRNDLISIDNFWTWMSEALPHATFGDMKNAVGEYAKRNKKTPDTLTPDARLRIWKAAKAGLFTVPGGTILEKHADMPSAQ